MDDQDIGYVAALIEGEGTVYLQRGASQGQWGYPKAMVTMTDKEPLERLQRILGGRLTGPYRYFSRSINEKARWTWCLSGWDNVEDLFELIVHLLSTRRVQQFEQVLKDVPPIHKRRRQRAAA